MTTHSKVPAWVLRRISQRPAARWISWNTGRPIQPETALREPFRTAELDYEGNVVPLFRRSA